MSRRVLVTGSRTWTDLAAIETALLEQIGPDGDLPTLIHGACPSGADRVASRIADRWGWDLEPHPADWAAHGKAAGFRRNAEMVAAGADVCLAFIRGGSRGASHCAGLAARAGIPTSRWEVPA